MGDEKLDKNGLIKVWLKIWTLIKLIVGDVDIVDKGDLQTQINNMGKRVSECFQSASDGKNLLADAITGKGVPTEANDTFATMAENISNIKEADDSINEESPNYRTGYNAGVAATKKGTAGTGDVLTGKTFTNASSVEAAGAMANKGAVTVDSGPVTQDDTYTYLAVPAAAFYNANSKLRTKNSNIEKMPGGNTGAPIYQGAANAGWNQWSGSRGLSYTFTKDYPEVMVYASGGCSGYGMSSSEDQVKASMYCNLYPGAATVSCTGGIVIKKNNYYIIKNVKAGHVVTVSFSPGGSQEVAVQVAIWEL